MTVKVLALVTINEDQPHALGQYFKITQPLLDGVGARIADRYRIAEGIVGAEPAQTAIIVDYPDIAAVRQVFGSVEYESAKKYRDIAFSTYSISVLT